MKITGQQNVLRALQQLKGTAVFKASEAVDKSLVDLVNHAKAGHAGNTAHMNDRYRNRTTNLTNSIKGGLTEITDTKVTGEAEAGMEYAQDVELGAYNPMTGRMNKPYPFMFPALVVAKVKLKERMGKLFKKG